MNCLTCKHNKSPKSQIAYLRLNENKINPHDRFEIMCKKSPISSTNTIELSYKQLTSSVCGPYKPI